MFDHAVPRRPTALHHSNYNTLEDVLSMYPCMAPEGLSEVYLEQVNDTAYFVDFLTSIRSLYDLN